MVSLLNPKSSLNSGKAWCGNSQDTRGTISLKNEIIVIIIRVIKNIILRGNTRFLRKIKLLYQIKITS